jgi:DNA repair protein SbcD/Mre11
MSTVRFIHCADLHLDTPFRGLSDVAPDVGKALNEATFKSFENIIDLAIAERVAFLVIAGDVYDSADRGLSAQFKFQKGVQRLEEHGIEVFVACGNHDPLSGWSATIEWPPNVHTFPANHVDSWQIARDDQVIATVHGISYPKEAVHDNLAARFARPDGLAPSVAVLHANVGGDTAHPPYAPTTVSELATKGFTYWALGHVHAHRVLRDNAPAIVYPGCSQSRHPNETGPKGCCLVTLTDSAPPDVRFVPTDVVRFHAGVVDVAGCDSQDALRRTVVDECRAISAGSQGRHAVIRLALTGRTSLHREIARANSLDALLRLVRDELEGAEPWVWLEKLHLKTRGSYDIATQRKREDFVGDLMSVYDNLLDSSTGQLAAWIQEMDDAMSSWQGYRFLTQGIEGVAITDEELLSLVEQARGVTLDQLVEEP